MANSLTLERSDIRYDINSSSQGSGFFVAPEDLTVEQAFEYFQSDSLPQSVQHLTILKTNRPNFKKKHRYWFYIKLNNQTHNQKWVLHFSHFFINHIEIILKPTTAPKASPSELLQFHQFDNHTTDKAPLLNILGRNFPITLTANQDYYLLFEIRAKNYGRPPYVGIMSQNYYDTWEKTLDRYFILSIGIILGLVSIAIICCLFLKDMSFFWFSVSSLCLLFLTLLRSPLLVKWIQISENLPIWFWLLIAFTNISMLMFARSFMLVDSKNKYIIKLLELFVYLYIGIFIISIFSTTLINGLLFSVMSVLTMGLIFYSACYKIFKNGAYYLIFMLGWLPIIFLLGESVYTVYSIPEDGSSTFSSKNIREPYFQILHMLLHMVAMLIRIMHLKKQKFQVQLESQAKSRFLASASHDLRQPLLSMGIFLAHLKDHISSIEGQSILNKAEHLQQSMDQSFSAIMDLSRLEANAINLHLQTVDLTSLIEKVMNQFQPLARIKHIELRSKFKTQHVYSDPELLERMIRNLISNAIKYTTQGGVLITIRQRKHHLLFQVWDTGIGINTDDQKIIFNIYQRSDRVSNSHTGMGIGLATAKEIGDLLGHEIEFTSIENKGSKFEIKFENIDLTPSSDLNYQSNLSKTSTQVNIQLEINDEDTLKQISAHLTHWNYGFSLINTHPLSNNKDIATPSITNQSSNDILLLIYLGDSLNFESWHKKITQLEKSNKHIAIALFRDKAPSKQDIINKDLMTVEQLHSLNIHILTRPFKASQLRSLIRFVEISK